MSSPLESEVILELLLSWLVLSDLCAVRALSRTCFDVVQRATRSLCAAHTKSSEVVSHWVRYFHQLTRLDLRFVELPDPEVFQCVTQLTQWRRLSEVVLHQIWYLNDDHLALLSRNMPELRSLTVSECFQVQFPSLHAPLLASLAINDCLLRGFQPSSHLPTLKSLAISSRVLDAINLRLVTKHLLPGSQLETLLLVRCTMVEQLLIDPEELPCLATLSVAQCSRLQRLHVASSKLRDLDVVLCVDLQHLIVVSGALSVLDLSFLTSLQSVYLHCASLQQLNLTGCSQLTKENIEVVTRSDSLRQLHLHGTQLELPEVLH